MNHYEHSSCDREWGWEGTGWLGIMVFVCVIIVFKDKAQEKRSPGRQFEDCIFCARGLSFPARLRHKD
jgi:hypothetical protein